MVDSYLRAGVPDNRLDLDLLGHLDPRPAAIRVRHFLVTIAAHVRPHDAAKVATSIVLTFIAAATHVLRLATL